jgi:glycosyltransferase involved in cell wall biosynthesis
MSNEDKKIAFLTAAYNGEKTLQRTIDSIKAQTHQNFEYFILNDGSSDGTQTIIDENCRLDPRIHSIYFEKNDCQEHFIAAIKEILLHNDIDYFAICDHDDEYLPTFAEETIHAAVKVGADAVFCGIATRSEKFGDREMIFFDDSIILRTPQQFSEAYPAGLCSAMRPQWGKLYSIKVIRKANLELIKTLKYGRDTIFCNEVTSYCDTIVLLNKPLYRFYVSDKSETNRFEQERINSPAELYKCARRFNETKCGEYADQNDSFLFFNYLQDLNFTTHQVINSDLSENRKISFLIQLFSDPVFLEAAAYSEIYSVHKPANDERLASFEKICDTAAIAFQTLFPFVNETEYPAFASAATHTAVLAGYEKPIFPKIRQAGN